MEEVFRTRHTVEIVPAAPSCETTLTAADASEQSGVDLPVDEVDWVVDPVGAAA